MAREMENLLLERTSGKFLELIIFCFLTWVVIIQVLILQKCIKLFLGFEHFAVCVCVSCHKEEDKKGMRRRKSGEEGIEEREEGEGEEEEKEKFHPVWLLCDEALL